MRFFRHILYAHFQALFLGSQALKTFMQACVDILCEFAIFIIQKLLDYHKNAQILNILLLLVKD